MSRRTASRGNTISLCYRERLIESGAARNIMKRLLKRAGRERLLSKEHFSDDGTLIEAWAAVKGMRRRDGRTSTSLN